MAARPHPAALLGSANPAGGRGAGLPAPHPCRHLPAHAAGRRQPLRRGDLQGDCPQDRGIRQRHDWPRAGPGPRRHRRSRSGKAPVGRLAWLRCGVVPAPRTLSPSSRELRFATDYNLFAFFFPVCLVLTPRCPGVCGHCCSQRVPPSGMGCRGSAQAGHSLTACVPAGGPWPGGPRWAGVQCRLQAPRPGLPSALARSFPAWLSAPSHAASSPALAGGSADAP